MGSYRLWIGSMVILNWKGGEGKQELNKHRIFINGPFRVESIEDIGTRFCTSANMQIKIYYGSFDSAHRSAHVFVLFHLRTDLNQQIFERLFPTVEGPAVFLISKYRFLAGHTSTTGFIIPGLWVRSLPPSSCFFANRLTSFW